MTNSQPWAKSCNFEASVVNFEVILKRLCNDYENVLLTIPGTGGVKDFYVLATDTIRDLDTYGGCQCFPLYYYEEKED